MLTPRAPALTQTQWEEGDTGDAGLFGSPRAEGGAGPAGTAKVGGAAKGDENDPLGLVRGGVLSCVLLYPVWTRGRRLTNPLLRRQEQPRLAERAA